MKMNLRKTWLAAVCAVAVVAGVAAVGGRGFAGELGFEEDFALSADRAATLKQLLPGTEDYFYYHTLYYQNTGDLAKAQETITAWIKRHGRTGRVEEMENRQALLSYDQNPQASLDYLARKLGLFFNHQQETAARQAQLPTALDPKSISRETLTAQALANNPNTLGGFENRALDWAINLDLSDERLHELLSRLTRPDYPNLTKLIVHDLNSRYNTGFGSLAIHSLLLPEQLGELSVLKPTLLNEQAFVNAYLAKLRPNPDVDWLHNPAEKKAYLERLWTFVNQLGPVHNSLKAHVLYQRLVFDRTQGVWDQERFQTYLKLPRQVFYINPRYMEQRENRDFACNLSADFQGVTLLPIIGTDEPLVRSYLLHLLVDAADYDAYKPLVQEAYLKEVFAEAKITAGVGDQEKWYAMLTPEQFQALKERVDLDFEFTNKPQYGPEEAVALDVWVKNVSRLTVKVFEINTPSYYRAYGREIDTDVNLDGLVANAESVETYTESPFARKARHFDFSKLNTRGIYIVELIGNGKSSRALVRKGKWRFLEDASATGHVFTILDEANKKVPEAKIYLGGQEYAADKDGLIHVPFSTNPGRHGIIIESAGFAALDHFDHQAEQYSLAAGIYVDREALLRRSKATVIIRPGLYVSGQPITPKLLEEVVLVLTSTDRDGVSTSKEVPGLTLAADKDTTYEFQVPDRLARLTFTLKAKIQNVSLNKKEDLAVSETFALNAIDTTDKVQDLYFAHIDGKYYVDVLGKTGEKRGDQAVNFVLQHRDFRQAVHVSLKTDANGRIALGSLDEILSVQATGPEGVSHTWAPVHDVRTQPAVLQGIAGEPIRVPYMGTAKEPAATEFSLLEVRGSVPHGANYVADLLKTATVQDGFVVLPKLPAGDYSLFFKDTQSEVKIRLTAGTQQDHWILGTPRYLDLTGRGALQITSVQSDAQTVKVQLANANKETRVHVFATRFASEYQPFNHFAAIWWPGAEMVTVAPPETVYVAGRNIGDEYRYIIDRKYAAKLPGNMLTRPSLLLNPWAIRKTETGEQVAHGGEDYLRKGLAESEGRYRGVAPARPSEPQATGFADLDFLMQPTVVLTNLVPDDKGLVTIQRNALDAKQQLHIVAIDPASTVYREISLPEVDAKPRDLRLAAALDVTKHFVEQKEITLAAKGQTLSIADLGTSGIEVYDTIGKVYKLYATLHPDATLAEFAFILNWPKLTPAEKTEKYSKYASHELSFFLSRKDPEFFKAVIQPYLKNKKDKTFLDHYLVEDDLSGYLKPWAYGQLNVVEKALLAQRITGEEPKTARFVKDRYDLIPPDIEKFNFLFKTALKGSALETTTSLLALAGDFEYSRRVAAETPDAAFDVGGKTGRLQPGGGGGGMGGGPGGRGNFMGRPATSPVAAPAPAAPAALRIQQEGVAKEAAQDALDMPARDQDQLKDMAKKYDDLALSDEKLGEMRQARQDLRRLYVKLDKTEEWAENNYYHLPIEVQNGGLIPLNGFWKDFAAHGAKPGFLSTHLAEPTSNFAEMLLALAVLDLPFDAPQHAQEHKDGRLNLTAGGPAVIFHKEIKAVEPVAEKDKTPILVSQNYFRANDRYTYVDNERTDKYVTEEFLTHVVYGAQVVVTNPTSSKQKLDLLLQIPQGALPVHNAQDTRGVHLDLEPYETKSYEYDFYFAVPGSYPHFPVQVAKNEKLINAAPATTLKVVETPSKVDTKSWDYISQYGTDAEVTQYLQDNNIERLNLEKIAWRMKEAKFAATIFDLLAARHVYNNTLWAYAVKHNQPAAIREFLQHADGFVAQCGAYLDSKLLTIDPVIRKSYQHLEYSPLVNARAHKLGKQRQIVNERFFGQYEALLGVLRYRPQLDSEDLMSVVYYLLLQDRVEEGQAFYGKVEGKKLPTQLQYDYLTAYLDFYKDKPTVARGLADKYAKYPVDRWQKLFAAVGQQVDEIEGKGAGNVIDKEDRNQQQTKAAAAEPTLAFKVEARKINVHYTNLAEVRINYYLMDIELMFSQNPFIQQFSGQFASIKPNDSTVVKLDPAKTDLTLDLPEKFSASNVMIEIRSGGQMKSQAYYANSLNVQIAENYGQVKVTGEADGKALPKVYVKVYARTHDGRTVFYKDGYTDLRGRFDYTSLNTNELDNVEKFAILVLSDTAGAVVREAAPPQR